MGKSKKLGMYKSINNVLISNRSLPEGSRKRKFLHLWADPWFLYYMVAHFTLRKYGVKQAFRFFEGIWLHRKSRQIRFFRKRPILHHTCATCSELPSYISTMGRILEEMKAV